MTRRQFNIRLSDDTRARLGHAAVDANISVNALAERLLLQALAVRESGLVDAALAWYQGENAEDDILLGDAIDEYERLSGE